MLDIAPDYAGIIFGVSNTIANVPGFVAPVVVGALLKDYADSSQWQAVFWIRLVDSAPFLLPRQLPGACHRILHLPLEGLGQAAALGQTCHRRNSIKLN
jgi:hypothetical protein